LLTVTYNKIVLNYSCIDEIYSLLIDIAFCSIKLLTDKISIAHDWIWMARQLQFLASISLVCQGLVSWYL